MKILFLYLIFINMIIKLICKNFYVKSNNKKGFDFRVSLYKDEENIHKASFWHDVDYKNNDNTFNMVVEIPKGETAKLEMSKETFNPIKQDSKKNKLTNLKYLRFYKLIPFFNYGFIPRTWESNKIKTMGNYKGDNDPIDLIELSENKRFYIGQISKVYIVGSFCLIDQGEVDWKILALNINSISYEQSLNYLKDKNNLEKIKNIQNWFKTYKLFEGKKINEIYDNDRIFNIEETKKIIEENHRYYMDLINGKI